MYLHRCEVEEMKSGPFGLSTPPRSQVRLAFLLLAHQVHLAFCEPVHLVVVVGGTVVCKRGFALGRKMWSKRVCTVYVSADQIWCDHWQGW